MNARDLKNIILTQNMIFLKFAIFIINRPIIGHLYDAFYFKIINLKIKKSGIKLIIEPNNTCNLKCIMCPYQKMKRKKETMPLELFRSIVDQAVEIGCKDFQLQHYNEPFIDKFIFKRINYLNSKNTRVILYSNRTLLTDENINQILKNPPSVIRFSVDGYSKEIYESIRKGAIHEKVISGIIKLFNERNRRNSHLPRIEIYFLIFEKNKHEIKKFRDFWKYKCDYMSFYPTDTRNSQKFRQVNYVKLKPYPCFNPKIILVLSNGEVGLCCMDVDGEENLGNLKNDPLNEIINSDKIKNIFISHLKRKCKIPLITICF